MCARCRGRKATPPEVSRRTGQGVIPVKVRTRIVRVLVGALVVLLALPSGLLIGPATPASAAVQTYAEVVLSTGDLIAYWQLTETEGDFVDVKGGHTAIPSGDPERLSTGPLLAGDTGAVGFPSADDYLTVADHEDFDLADGPFSIEVWLRRDVDGNASQVLLSKQEGAFVLGVDADDRLYFGRSGGPTIAIEEGETPADGTWHHIVVTRVAAGSGNTRLYKDGADVTVEVTPSTPLSDTDDDLVVGRETSASPLGGALAHLAIYARALEASEVAAHNAAARDPCPVYGFWVTYGTSGDDVLVGTTGDDVICALSGNDEIDGAGGNDVIYGGPGNDIISTSSGDDEIDGGAGDDVINGGAGASGPPTSRSSPSPPLRPSASAPPSSLSSPLPPVRLSAPLSPMARSSPPSPSSWSSPDPP